MKIDNQQPTFSAGFLRGSGEGQYAVEMSAEHGMKPDPWQELLVKQIYIEKCVQIGISAPRQNGKNGVAEIVELYSPTVCGHKILHTAHRRDTVMKHFARLCARWYENRKYKDLMQHCDVTHGSGFQEIVFDTGGRISFITRSDTGGRGDSVDYLILDEAQEMTEGEWAALVPTLTASPNAKILMFGTPPVSSRVGKGIVFQRFRQDAYDGNLSEGEMYAEWGITDLKKDDVKDIRTQERVNPAWNYRINKNIVRIDSRNMETEEFAREHLGYWYKGAKNTIYKEDQWTTGIVKKRPAIDGVVRFAVGIVYAQDGESWAAAFGAVMGDGNYYTELIDLANMKKGTIQILQIIGQFYKSDKFVGALVHGKAGALNLLGDAEACNLFKPAIIELCRYDSKVASNTLFDTLMSNDEIQHIDQEPLKESLLSLDKYMINKGGGFGFVSRTGKLIAAEASALALYWAKNRKPKPKRGKQTVW